MTSSTGLAAEPNVGEHERFGVRATLETDTGLLAHGAVDAVGADHVAGPDDVAVVECRRHPVGVLVIEVSIFGLMTAAELDQPRSSSSLSVVD